MTREQRLLAIVQAQTEIAASRLDPQAVMAVVADRARDVTGAEAAVVELLEGDSMVYAHAVGTAAPFVGTRLAAAASLSGRCMREGRVIRCDDARGDERVDGDAAARVGAIAMICAPLAHGGAPVGVLKVYSAEPNSFDAEDEETLTLLSGVMAAHLDHAESHATTVRLSSEDALTGVGNRRAFDDRLELECARRARECGHLTLVLADLDGFKAVNDGHGHPAGDGILRTVAAVLRRWTRSIDGVYRIGGDEFALVLPGATAEAAAVLVERITAQLADAHPLGITASFGIAAATGDDPAGLVAAADAELYRVKRTRRSRAAAA
jgi:diguanylate cyclase (GGDEF)-like protein